MTSELDELIGLAERVRKNAYAPYSNFQVGAAIRSASGKVFTGVNVENASFGGTICAERNAIAAMVAAGERELVEVAVYTEADPPAMPCGLCRQVLFEFGPNARVVAASPSTRKVTTLRELLPEPFLFRK